jgi:lipid-A-disaccharide synthase
LEQKTVKVLISAAEASSDAHGAELLRALKELGPQGQTVEAYGIGGPKLQAMGLRAVVDTRELLAMGFTEIIGRLPRIRKALRALVQAARDDRPDVAIVIDYPEFHFRLALKLKRLGIPVVYYIPPKVWVWRRGRIHTLKKFVDRVLCIFPFEAKIYREAKVSARYVGNPLIDELPLELSRKHARQKLELSEESLVLVAMPGSRPAEIKRHLPLMLAAALNTAAKLRSSKLDLLVPLPVTADLDRIRAKITEWLKAMRLKGEPVDELLCIRVSSGDSAECLVAADAGLIKSGTSTLEAALLGCPHVIVYKPSALSAWVFKNLIRYRGPVGLTNLATGWKPGQPYRVREILCEEATVQCLTAETLQLLTDEARRQQIKKELQALKETLAGGVEKGSVSRSAAREIFEVVAQCRGY